MSRTAPLTPIFLLMLLLPVSGGEDEVFYPEKAVIESFAREVPLNGSLTLKVTLKRRHHSPVLAITHPDGSTEYHLETRTAPGRKYEFDVGFKAGRGPYRVELVVDSVRGDTTAAQFTIYAGLKKPKATPTTGERRSEPAYEPESLSEHPVRLERKLFAMLNAYRKKLRIEPFPWLEKAAILAREHWKDYLKLKPRPKRFTHRIPGPGFIADRFFNVYAWPITVRKFPIFDPNIGPEATCYCSESLASTRSLDKLFREVLLKESAFRAPVISEYPTHAAVGIVRDLWIRPEESSEKSAKQIPRLFTAVVYVQVNSTRVRREIADEIRSTTSLEAKARKPGERAKLLRRLGRMGDPKSHTLFARRLNDRKPEVRAAALDCLFLNEPAKAAEWVRRRLPRVARAHQMNRFADVVPLLRTLAGVLYDAPTRLRGEKELAYLERLSSTYLKSAMALLARGETADGRETLELIATRFTGLPAASLAQEKLEEISPRDGPIKR